MRKLFPAALFLVFAFAACSGDDGGGPAAPPEPDPIILTGTWEGDINGGGTLRLSLVENSDGALSGSGRATSTSGQTTIALTVKAGSHTDDTFAMTLGAEGFEDMSYDGQVRSCSEIAGNLYGSGFNGEGAALLRQGTC